MGKRTTQTHDERGIEARHRNVNTTTDADLAEISASAHDRGTSPSQRQTQKQERDRPRTEGTLIEAEGRHQLWRHRDLNGASRGGEQYLRINRAVVIDLDSGIETYWPDRDLEDAIDAFWRAVNRA